MMAVANVWHLGDKEAVLCRMVRLVLRRVLFRIRVLVRMLVHD
jgi:hypothetical protein